LKSRYLKTEAIVLNSIKFGEGHKIVNLFTRDLGKVEATAFGARKTKSRFGSLLEPFSHIKVLMYRKSEDVPFTIREAEPLSLHPGLRNDYNKIVFSNAIIEPFIRIVQRSHPDKRLFLLLKNSLNYMEFCNYHSLLLLLSIFDIVFIQLMGYGIQTDNCELCGVRIEDRNYFFDPEKGFPICKRCASSKSLVINYEAIRFVNWAKRLNISDNSFLKMLRNVRIGRNTYMDLRMLIEKMYLYTFEKGLSSWKEIRKIIMEMEKK